MNTLSSLNGVLSRIDPPVKNIFSPDTDQDIIVDIGGERYVPGQDEKLVSVKVEYNVRGGALCTLEWAFFQMPRIGAPVTVYIGATVFWAGTIVNGVGSTWEAQPLQAIFEQIYFYDLAYVGLPFAGPVSELIKKVFLYASKQNPSLSLGTVAASDALIECEVNSRTLKDILDTAVSFFENEESVYGITNEYVMFFSNISRTNEVLINEDAYGGELVQSVESDNVHTVFSVFKNKEVKIIDEQGEEDFIYPVEFIGKVGIGVDPVSKQYYPPVPNYFIYGHREERWDIDAPDMLPSTALQDAYNTLRKITPTYTIKAGDYRYAKYMVPIGSSVRIYTKNTVNVSITVPINRENIIVGKQMGALAVVQETEVNEGWTEGSGGAAKISDMQEWIEQVGLVNKVIEITIGYSARYDGTITIKSGNNSYIKNCSNSSLPQFFTVKNENGFDKFDLEILTQGAVDLISMYALGDYGQAMYRGYLRSVILKSSIKGTFFELEIKSFGSLPVLTVQRLQEKIRSVESISLRGK